MSTFGTLKAAARAKADANGDGKISLADFNHAIDHAGIAAHAAFAWGVAVGVAAALVIGWLRALF